MARFLKMLFLRYKPVLIDLLNLLNNSKAAYSAPRLSITELILQLVVKLELQQVQTETF